MSRIERVDQFWADKIPLGGEDVRDEGLYIGLAFSFPALFFQLTLTGSSFGVLVVFRKRCNWGPNRSSYVTLLPSGQFRA